MFAEAVVGEGEPQAGPRARAERGACAGAEPPRLWPGQRAGPWLWARPRPRTCSRPVARRRHGAVASAAVALGGRAEERNGGEWRMGRVWPRGLDKIASGRARGAGADVEPSWTAALASTGGKSGKNVNIFSLPC